MPRFVWKPEEEGREPRSWDFSPEKLLSPEAELIEKLTEWTFGEWGEKLGAGSVTAIHALLYVFLKRDWPHLRYDEVTFTLAEIDIEYDDDDVQRGIEALQLKEGRTASEQKTLDDLLWRQMADGAPKEEAPPAPTSADGMSQPSPST